MTRKGVFSKNCNRLKAIKRSAGKRAELSRMIVSDDVDLEKKNIAMGWLDKSAARSKIKYRILCHITGRSRGIVKMCNSKYKGISRLVFRKYALLGKIRGVKKSSW